MINETTKQRTSVFIFKLGGLLVAISNGIKKEGRKLIKRNELKTISEDLPNVLNE
jgi:hypothetical protein